MAEEQILDAMPSMRCDPECNHCGSSLRYEDAWICDDCHVMWETQDPFDTDQEAVFLDEDDAVCGVESTQEPHEVKSNLGNRYLFTDLPCPLPGTHSSGHLFPTKSLLLSTEFKK